MTPRDLIDKIRELAVLGSDREDDDCGNILNEIDNYIALEAAKQQNPAVPTLRVRVGVLVNKDQDYFAIGWNAGGSDSVRRTLVSESDMDVSAALISWIEADVPLPPEATVQGEVQQTERINDV